MPDVLTVVGARPQFVKAKPLSDALQKYGLKECILHTGQHYDARMSRIFFEELSIPDPDINLEVGSGSHAQQTARMMEGIEKAVLENKPAVVLVYGDTNSTLAAAIVASKCHVPVAHVEAGLRSYNRQMPEEINRIMTDVISTRLYCPTQTAIDNLAKEGVTNGVLLVGDVMEEALAQAHELSKDRKTVEGLEAIPSEDYAVLTLHRAENTDDSARLNALMNGMLDSPLPIYWPLHPRTKAALERSGLMGAVESAKHIILLEPLGYLDMVALMAQSNAVLTDSGGLQKEAFWLGVPVITLRDQTEWVETVQAGGNVLVGADQSKLKEAIANLQPVQEPRYSTESAADCIAADIAQMLK